MTDIKTRRVRRLWLMLFAGFLLIAYSSCKPIKKLGGKQLVYKVSTSYATFPDSASAVIAIEQFKKEYTQKIAEYNREKKTNFKLYFKISIIRGEDGTYLAEVVVYAMQSEAIGDPPPCQRPVGKWSGNCYEALE